MKKLISVFMMSFFVLALFAIAGCTKIEKVYVCANGKEVTDIKVCGINKVAGVKKMEAEEYSKRYVGAYFSPYGGKTQLVSAYLDPDAGDYFATFVVAEKEGTPYQTVVIVDGKTGKVNCTEKCDYVK